MKSFLPVILLFWIFSCEMPVNNSTGKLSSKPESVSPTYIGKIAPVDDSQSKVIKLKLTWDKEENIRRISEIPGFDTLSTQQQQDLRRMLLMVLPNTILKDRSSKPKLSGLISDTCVTGLLSAANCPPVIVTYHLLCPEGLVFNSEKCFCDWPANAPDYATRCYSMFQFEVTGSGYFKMTSGHWTLTATAGHPGWCGDGCTMHL